MESKKVSIETLIEYPGNPRKGDIDKIAESLEVNGQYKPIVVQKNTNYVLVGNHTLKAIIKLGWKSVDIVELDVDDIAAKKIVLADNRTSDGSVYDYTALNNLLTSLPDLKGTGYSLTNLDELLSNVNAYSVDLGLEDMGSRGLGNPIIHYDIVFDNEEQQNKFYQLIKYLKIKYPDTNTVAERLITWIDTLEL